MKCLVINLDRSPDRLAHVTAEFARIGVAFERVAAVDGASRTDLIEMSPDLLPFATACFLSHRACWRIIAEGDDEYGAIFEDDVILSDKAALPLTDASWIPLHADIVKLETVFWKLEIGIKAARIGQGFSVSRLYGDTSGSCGYIVSKRAASGLIEASKHITDAVDSFLFQAKCKVSSRMTMYQLIPALCTQDQALGDKGIGLESQNLDRPALEQSDPTKRRKVVFSTRIAIEVKRLSGQIVIVLRMRRKKTIPFYYRGKRIIQPQ